MCRKDLEANKEFSEKVAVLFIFYDPKNNSILLEKRNKPGSFFDGQTFYPGGSVENTELANGNIGGALEREIREEIGVLPEVYERVPCKEIYGETGYLLIPFLITKWQGEIPAKVLDTESQLLWLNLDDYNPNLRSVQKVTQVLRNFLGSVAQSCTSTLLSVH